MYSSYPNTVILPMRAKVSADFGTAVNTDNFGAASAGVTYTGALRNFWLPDQGLLINVSADEGQFEDLILTAPALIVPGGGIYSWRPVRAQAAGLSHGSTRPLVMACLPLARCMASGASPSRPSKPLAH